MSGERKNFLMNLLVRFEDRPDGGLRAFCDQVPGFGLSSSDPERVKKQVPVVLKHLLARKYKAAVDLMEVERSPDVIELYELDEQAGQQGASEKQYTAVTAAAA